jgi:hypothetical protein
VHNLRPAITHVNVRDPPQGANHRRLRDCISGVKDKREQHQTGNCLCGCRISKGRRDGAGPCLHHQCNDIDKQEENATRNRELQNLEHGTITYKNWLAEDCSPTIKYRISEKVMIVTKVIGTSTESGGLDEWMIHGSFGMPHYNGSLTKGCRNFGQGRHDRPKQGTKAD